MAFDFDEAVSLRNTHSQKFDSMAKYTGAVAEDAIPMWVADMDFRAPAAVSDALRAEVDRGVFGYFGDDRSTRSAITAWMRDRHDWTVEPEWIHFSYGVVHGLSMVLEAFTQPGDGVIVFSPVYHAFYRKLKAKDRQVIESHLKLEDGRYEMDLEALADQLSGSEKVLIFCSPHNPGGRLWSAAEINALADFCLAHDLILVSDEVHMDLTFPGEKHLVTATTASQAVPNLITLTSASKGFNIAGAETGFIVTGDDALRDRLAKAHAAHGGTPNRFGMLMLEACFTDGHDWSEAVRAYIAANFRLFREGVNAIPGLSVMDMSATYLAWVDFSGTGMERQEFSDRVGKKARIGVSPGHAFGIGGENFLRFNIATQRVRVEEAVQRLAAAFSDLQ